MPQPKSSSTPKSSPKPAAKKTAAKKTAAKPAAKKTAAKPNAKKPAAKKTAATPAAKKAAAKPAAKRSAQPSAAATGSDAARDEALKANLGALRELLAGGVVLTAQRVQESLDEAVERGRMTRRDAEDLARGLLDAGRRQSADILADVEQLLGRSRAELGERGDRVLREVDRVRRGAHVGPSFPILNFTELNAAQIEDRLGDLTPAQLRKVRDFERRNENRKGVLDAIERKLA